MPKRPSRRAEPVLYSWICNQPRLVAIKKGGNTPLTVAALFLAEVDFNVPVVNPGRVYRNPAVGGALGAHASLEIKPPAMADTNCSSFPRGAPVQQFALMGTNIFNGPELLPVSENSYPPCANKDLGTFSVDEVVYFSDLYV